MMYLIVPSQETISARCPVEFLIRYRQGSYHPEPTAREFMENVAYRAGEWNGSIVRIDTPENFLTDLMDGGFVEEIANDQ